MSSAKAGNYPIRELNKYRPSDLMRFISSGKILDALEKNRQLTIKELENYTGISRGTVRTVLRKLIKSGLVSKKKSTNSKQAFVYELTDLKASSI
ncbi:MAG: ArsR family transcriptional regulator [Candidatus Odinarchaeota archaeon]